MPIKINSRGFWEVNHSNKHIFDEEFADAIGYFLSENKCKSCLDIGCGNGAYTKHLLNKFKIPTIGIDGNPYTFSLTNDDKNFLIKDFSQDFPNSADWKISIEVGEHIPKEHEDTFLKNLCMGVKGGIVLSWALPKQDGDGHVNCMSNEDVIEKMYDYNFIYDKEASETFRHRTTLAWLKKTVMVFRKRYKLPNKINVIGNGPSALEKQNGGKIDNLPTIRINNYKLKDYENFVGTRTDYWATSFYSDIEYRPHFNVFVPFKRTLNKFYSPQFDKFNKLFLPTTIHNELEADVYPSTGMRLLYWLALENVRFNLFGFDLFKNKLHYFDDNIVGSEHCEKSETVILNKINDIRDSLKLYEFI